MNPPMTQPAMVEFEKALDLVILDARASGAVGATVCRDFGYRVKDLHAAALAERDKFAADYGGTCELYVKALARAAEAETEMAKAITAYESRTLEWLAIKDRPAEPSVSMREAEHDWTRHPGDSGAHWCRRCKKSYEALKGIEHCEAHPGYGDPFEAALGAYEMALALHDFDSKKCKAERDALRALFDDALNRRSPTGGQEAEDAFAKELAEQKQAAATRPEHLKVKP